MKDLLFHDLSNFFLLIAHKGNALLYSVLILQLIYRCILLSLSLSLSLSLYLYLYLERSFTQCKWTLLHYFSWVNTPLWYSNLLYFTLLNRTYKKPVCSVFTCKEFVWKSGQACMCNVFCTLFLFYCVFCFVILNGLFDILNCCFWYKKN